ncbi:MAG TPA: tRNA-dihydrouridine synthase family protein [Candidatus Woesearchaeota archaeon]|nr:tRNA-dihydrouridine synthase family protein [Candidatus Woesearchaeota archaeon]
MKKEQKTQTDLAFDFKDKLVLAPMSLYNDTAFRKLCLELGADLTYTPLLSVKSIIFQPKKAQELFSIISKVRPVAIQLFGYDENDFLKASTLAKDYCDLIDINCGCPAPKVLKSKGGSYLLKEPKKIASIIKTLKKSLNITLTIKIRLGFENNIVTKEVVKLSEKAGVDAIAIHPRTVEQKYSGIADWNAIKEIKNISKVPIIGNGDVKNNSDYQKLKSETLCDSVMIGRTAGTNPLIFNEIKTKIDSIKEPYKIFNIIEKYKKYLSELKEPRQREINALKTHILSFLQGVANSKQFRYKISIAQNVEEIEKELKQFKNSLE